MDIEYDRLYPDKESDLEQMLTHTVYGNAIYLKCSYFRGTIKVVNGIHTVGISVARERRPV